jgi:hypothetical protein
MLELAKENNKINEIYSNNKDFDRVQWIKKFGNKPAKNHSTNQAYLIIHNTVRALTIGTPL